VLGLERVNIPASPETAMIAMPANGLRQSASGAAGSHSACSRTAYPALSPGGGPATRQSPMTRSTARALGHQPRLLVICFHSRALALLPCSTGVFPPRLVWQACWNLPAGDLLWSCLEPSTNHPKKAT